MRNLLIFCGLFACSIGAVTFGLLYVFSPQLIERFIIWCTRADRWSAPKNAKTRPASVSERVAGILMTLIGSWMIVVLLSGRLLRTTGSRTVAPQAKPPGPADAQTSTLVIGLAVVAFGIYEFFRPDINLRLMQKNFPTRELSPEAVKRTLRGGRTLGIFTIAIGAFVLFLWYTQTR